MRSVWLAVILVACGDNNGTVPPDGMPPPPDGGVEPFGVSHAGGMPNVVVVTADRVFLGIGPRLQVQTLGGELLVQSEPLRGTIDAIAVVNDRAFVAEHLDLDSKIHVFDISSSSISEVGAPIDLSAPGGFSVVRDIEESSVGTLYVADQEQGVIEIQHSGEVVRMVPLPGVQQLQRAGTRLYHSAVGFIGGVSLGALDTTNALASLGEASYDAASIAVAGDFAISAGQNGIFVHAISDPANPVERLHIGEPGEGPFARAIAVSGTTAWVPATNGLHTIDVTDPNNLRVVAPNEEPTVGVNAASASGDTLIAITDRGRMLTFDIANPIDPGPPFVADITLCADCVDVTLAPNDMTLVADILGGAATAWVWNLGVLGRSPATDVVPGPDGLTLVFEGVTFADSHVFAADWLYGLRIYDATNPDELVELGSLDTPGAPSNVAVVGQRAYLAESTGGGALRVIDISNPARPTELGAIATSKAMEVEVRGTLAYVADEAVSDAGGLKIYDVANPAAIALVGTYSTECEFPRDVAVEGNLAIVACSSEGWHVVDVTNPAAPTRLAVIPAPEISSAWSVAAYPGFAVLGHDRGVIVTSLANPRAPTEVERHATAFAVRALAAKPGHAIGAAGLAGVYQWIVP